MNSQKKIMLLGGIHYLLPVIKAAHEQGYYVITADYLPDNVAHQYSDEYCNVNIIDKEAVLQAAKALNIDGIISFGVDPGVVSAAYVQEQMGLPQMGPYESVRILQNKDLFRAFLKEHGFNVPNARSYTSKEIALSDTDWFSYPMIVKPTDSAGSKGVTRIDSLEEYADAVDYAFEKSISGTIIVEEFIDKVGCSSDTDSFLLNGELKFISFNAQRFDENAANPYTPAAFSWPSTFAEHEEYLRSELQRLLSLLNMKTSVFNIETRVASNGKPYIMECTPRGGGNRLCEMLRYATGVDLITAQVRAAVGDSVEDVEQQPYNGHWAEVILHSYQDGIFHKLEISNEVKPYVRDLDLWVKSGDEIHAFSSARYAIGTVILCFPTEEMMLDKLNNQQSWLKVKLK
jgi:biotin carboxylase